MKMIYKALKVFIIIILVKFQNQLQAEMIKLQQVMTPIMGKLTQGLGFGGGYGGYGDMGDMNGYGDMGGMGGMPTMEKLQQLHR